MKLAPFFILLLFYMSSCLDSVEDKQITVLNLSQDEFALEHQRMIKELDSIAKNSNPYLNYQMNSELAEILRAEMQKGPMQKRVTDWFRFCRQLLHAGKTEKCIVELENYLHQGGKPYNEIINTNTLPIFDMLALAYLRLGEQRNCQNNHTEYSCILPLKEGGMHKDKLGSATAVRLYELLMENFPNEKYKWLLNVAYMTLGQHPQGVPQQYLIPFPNYDMESKKFPEFKEISMNVGVSQMGLSGGVCVDDFNRDGFLDIFATSYGMSDQCRLFLNDTKGSFTDVTEESNLLGIVSGLNCLHADYDNDGWIDILILRGAWLGEGGNHPNSLLKNLGNGKFTDVTRLAGLLSYHPTQTAVWRDFNNDGFLDLFIGNESTPEHSHPCELYENNGDGTFSEKSNKYGLENLSFFVKGVTSGDIDNDGWQDLYISNLSNDNILFRNDKGVFKNISMISGTKEPQFSFPTWFFDLNNDGFEDIFVSGYDVRKQENIAINYVNDLVGENISIYPALYLNQGDNTFNNMTEEFNLNHSMYSMGANYGDLDNDGFLDFYVGTGAPDFSTIVPNRMFRNLNGDAFEEVTSAGNFGHIQKGHGISFSDMDNDGDQDIYAVMGGAYEGDTFTNVLYENPIHENNWIVIELEGTRSNRSAIGTKVKLILDNGRTIYRTVSTGGSFGSSSLQLEIGLAKAQKINTLEVLWCSGKREMFHNIEPNKKIHILEGTGKTESREYRRIELSKVDPHHHH